MRPPLLAPFMPSDVLPRQLKRDKPPPVERHTSRDNLPKADGTQITPIVMNSVVSRSLCHADRRTASSFPVASTSPSLSNGRNFVSLWVMSNEFKTHQHHEQTGKVHCWGEGRKWWVESGRCDVVRITGRGEIFPHKALLQCKIQKAKWKPM